MPCTSTWSRAHGRCGVKTAPLIVNAYAKALLAKGSRQTTDLDFKRTVEVSKFTDVLGSGEQLLVHCTDARQQLNFDIRFWVYETRESLVVETMCTNVSDATIVIPQISLETSEEDGCFWPDTTKVLDQRPECITMRAVS